MQCKALHNEALFPPNGNDGGGRAFFVCSLETF